MGELKGFLPASAVVETEYIPYLLTEKGSLVFTIAPNGHIWGHRVEDGGTKRDIELEVYAPVSGGCAVRRKGMEPNSLWASENDLTEEQRRAIRRILAQKALRGILGTLVSPCFATVDLLGMRYVDHAYELLPVGRGNLDASGSNSINIKTADCLLENQISRSGFFEIKYLDDAFVFQISTTYYGCAGGAVVANFDFKKLTGEGSATFVKARPEDLVTLYREGYRFFERGMTTEFPHYIVSAAQAKDKKFFVGNFPACVERNLFPNELTVLCDTENVFDVFQIDDAILLLEEKRLSETESELYWTFAVAMNKIMQEQRRIKSNNPGV